MKKSKKLNAELAKIECRVVILQEQANKDEVAKNLLSEKVEVELEKIERGAARIEGCKLRCNRNPVDK